MTNKSHDQSIIVKEVAKSELDNWSAVHGSAVIINEFMDFLSSKGIILCQLDKEYQTYHPILKQRDDLIYECYNINSNKLESERRELLAKIQSKQQKVNEVHHD